MRQHHHKYPILLLILLITAVLPACAAEIHVNTIPAPAESPRLRVYVEPFTTFADSKPGQPGWETSHEEFVEKQVYMAERFLARTGIYEIVGRDEVRAAIGDQKLTRHQMERNDCELARKIGRALHTDYVMILERGTNNLLHERYFVNVLINVETGKKFGAHYSFQRRGMRNDMKEIIRAAYRDVFISAKDDLFAAAIRKGQRISSSDKNASSAEVAVSHPTKPVDQSALQKEIKPQSNEVWTNKKDVEDVMVQDKTVAPGAKLVVYDIDAAEQYKTAALIFSEALREEIFKLRKFTLVNREDLDELLKEMALQQTGLIDDKEAVRTGKGLAANQVVTGKMGLLGKTFVLQAKRINVETFATIGSASIKFSPGREDDAFDKMQEFAAQLTQ